jgi:hypothetical protein
MSSSVTLLVASGSEARWEVDRQMWHKPGNLCIKSMLTRWLSLWLSLSSVLMTATAAVARAGGSDVYGREKSTGCGIYIEGGLRVCEAHIWGSGTKSSTWLCVGTAVKLMARAQPVGKAVPACLGGSGWSGRLASWAVGRDFGPKPLRLFLFLSFSFFYF